MSDLTRIEEILEDIHDLLEEKLNAIDWKLWELYKNGSTEDVGDDTENVKRDPNVANNNNPGRPPRRRERE